jgi:hypothetical protein
MLGRQSQGKQLNFHIASFPKSKLQYQVAILPKYLAKEKQIFSENNYSIILTLML